MLNSIHTRPIILIQGPDYSKAERVREVMGGSVTIPAYLNNISIIGFENIYKKITQYFSLDHNFKLFALGDSNTEVNITGIIDLLTQAKTFIAHKNKVLPLIFVIMHGTVTKNDVNFDIKSHCMKSHHTSSEVLCTANVFKLIHDYVQIPIEIVLISCSSGPAIKYVHLLPKDSKLITFSNSEAEVPLHALVNSFNYFVDNDIKDFSILTLLESYFLSDSYRENNLQATISISGKKIFTFENFYNSKKWQQSINELLKPKIDEEFKKFSFNKLINIDEALNTLIQGQNLEKIENLLYQKILAILFFAYSELSYEDLDFNDVKELYKEIKFLTEAKNVNFSIALRETNFSLPDLSILNDIKNNTGFDYIELSGNFE